MRRNTLVLILTLLLFFHFEEAFAQNNRTDTIHKNVISFSTTGVMATQFAFHYERNITKNLMIDFPLVYSDLPAGGCGESFTNVLYSGVSLNYYIPNNRNLKYFAGLGFRYGVADYLYAKCDDDGEYLGKDTEAVSYTKVLINNGVGFHLWPRIPVKIMLSLGPRFYVHPYSGQHEKCNTGYFTIDVGYRF